MAFSFEINSRDEMIAFGIYLGEQALQFRKRMGRPLMVALDSPGVATGKSLVVLAAGLVVDPKAYPHAQEKLPITLTVNSLFEPDTIGSEIRPNQPLVFLDLSARPWGKLNQNISSVALLKDCRKAYSHATLIAVSNLNSLRRANSCVLKRNGRSALDVHINVACVGNAVQRRLSISTTYAIIEQNLKTRLLSVRNSSVQP